MKIAMIGQRGVPATFGGVERHVEELGARLAADGHEVVVFCRRGYGESEPERVPRACGSCTSTPSTRSTSSRSWPAPRRPRRRSGRATTSCTSTPSGPGCSPRSCALLSGARVVQTIHGLDGERAKWGARRQRAAALRHVAERPGARRARSSCRSRSRRPTASGTASETVHIVNGTPEVDPAPGRGDHRAVGPDPWELRAVGRPPGAREGARAPAGRVRRRPRGHPARAGRRLEPHRRVRRRPARDGRVGPPRDHGGLRLRRRARGAVLQRRGLRPPLAARGPAPHPPGGGQLRLLHRGERHPAPRRGRRLVGPRRPPLPDR